MLSVFGRKTKVLPVGDDVQKAVITAAAASRRTWYEWTGAITQVMRPMSLVTVGLLVLVFLQWHQNSALETEAQKVHPMIVVTDPTQTKVLRTITVDEKMYTPSQAAEEDFVKRWVSGFFGVTSDVRAQRKIKGWTRSHIIDQTSALTKVDAYYAQHDPFVVGQTETVDVVNPSVTPEIGDHRYRFTATIQPYEGSDALPAHDIAGDMALEVLLPEGADAATTEYPYVYVKELSWGNQ